MAAMQSVLDRPGREYLSIARIMLFPLAAWFVYVPLHELSHAFGCLASGGSVTELQIASLYGGQVLARIVPFVTVGSDYAGRLSGFDTHGSDLVYLATDFAPFVLTVAFASLALRKTVDRRSGMLLGTGAVLYGGTVISLVGDYYEMGSILVSRLLSATLGPAVGETATQLRHDDLVLFVTEFAGRFPDYQVAWVGAAALSCLVGLVLVTLTFAASQALADRLMGRADRRLEQSGELS